MTIWIHGEVFCFLILTLILFLLFFQFIFLGVYAVYTNSLQTHLMSSHRYNTSLLQSKCFPLPLKASEGHSSLLIYPNP